MADRPGGRRLTTRLADTFVSHSGDDGLQRYLRMVEVLVPGHGPRARYVRTTLSYLPSPRRSVVRIKAHPAAFVYESTPEDDLQFTCRRDFVDWEPVSRWFFYLAAQNVSQIVDVGAYSGVYSVTAAVANEEASILALEPNPPMYELAATNVARNGLDGRVQLRQVAAGEDLRQARLFLPRYSSMASLVEEGDESVEVSQEPLDALLDGEALHLMKVDVEGGESAVFKGGESTLARWQPTIVAEALSDAEVQSQFEVLSKYGYVEPISVDPRSTSGDSRNFVWTPSKGRDDAHRLLEQARRLSMSPRG